MLWPVVSSGSRRHSPPRASRRHTASTGSKLLGSPPYAPHVPSHGKAWGPPRPGLFGVSVCLGRSQAQERLAGSMDFALLLGTGLVIKSTWENAFGAVTLLCPSRLLWRPPGRWMQCLCPTSCLKGTPVGLKSPSPIWVQSDHPCMLRNNTNISTYVFWIFFCGRSITVEPCFLKRLPSWTIPLSTWQPFPADTCVVSHTENARVWVSLHC